jgi:hypothetical protein
MNDIKIGHFISTTYIVGFNHCASLKHPTNCTAVVFHVKPITNLLAITLYWQIHSCQCAHNHKRDELLWKAKKPIIIDAVSG